MRIGKNGTKGALLIETSIVLPLFILVTVFVYGIFNIANAQNQLSHVLIQTTESLSMDKYLNDKVHSVTGISESDSLWGGLDDAILEIVRSGNDPYYSSKIEWYQSPDSTGEETARKRLIGYLCKGDEEAADAKLKALGVVDGLDGVDITVTVESADVTVTLDYTLQFWVDVWDVGKIPMEQSVTSRFWGGAVENKDAAGGSGGGSGGGGGKGF